MRKRVLIIGAGAAGRKVVLEIRKEKRADIVPVGFLDDDQKKRQSRVAGLPVLGTLSDLPRIAKARKVDQILISTPSVGREFVQRVTRLVPAGIDIKILPSIASVISGKVDLSFVRDVDPSDLIGRPLIKSDQRFISKHAKGKTFLITGGAGSIGSELVRQLFNSHAKRIIIVDSWEEGIYHVTEELAENAYAGQPEVHAFIGNIRDKKRMGEIMRRFKVNVILHAAAYKHVPLMEDNADEAKKTNVAGTKNMLELAHTHGVKDFVLISTDKAVNPKSVMGKTKRAAELLVKQYARKYPKSRFCAVRFGNVVNSSGSIIPKFLKQIRSRSPVTITDRAMTRYFMSIPEAISLVLLSWIQAKNGQILILDMGKPVKIIDLATNLIKMHGLEPHKDIVIREVGARPGEKMHEQLAYDKSRLRPSADKRIFIAEEISNV
jgi:FlaA1/EpsC-like NDP-sugar epimerase